MKADATVKARIPAVVKDRALDVLGQMGLSASDFIRLVFLRVADEGRLPFELEMPNRITCKAMTELVAGKGKNFADAESLFKDLGI
jgi:DNA-damage-inducible protein J